MPVPLLVSGFRARGSSWNSGHLSNEVSERFSTARNWGLIPSGCPCRTWRSSGCWATHRT